MKPEALRKGSRGLVKRLLELSRDHIGAIPLREKSSLTRTNERTGLTEQAKDFVCKKNLFRI